MTITPRSQADYPEGTEPLDDSDWVRSVVSAALVQASIPDEQANRVLAAATAAPENPQVTSAPFSAPQKPQADDWPDLEAGAKIALNKQRLAEQRPTPEAYLEGTGIDEALIPGTALTEPPPAEADFGKDLFTKDLFTEDVFVESPGLEPPLGVQDATPDLTGWPSASESPSSGGQRTATKSRIPVLSDQGTSVGGVHDEVLSESDASLEGYRSSTMRTIIEWLVVVFLALVVAVLAKEFIVQAFWIPSESMETTVNVGDRVLVNKLSYQFNDVRRGDLVVFEKVEGTPGDTDDLIKRAVALPGETIEVRSDGRLWIWGAGETPDDALLLEEPYLDVQNALLNAPSSSDAPSATIWHDTCVNSRGDGSRCTLDAQSYFMLGDNRSRSFDSRGFGPVPEENLIGRAFLRIWPLGEFSTL